MSPVTLSLQHCVALRRSLLTWYRSNKRSLPWREAKTPYAVWVSEVMLQQTRVDVVRDYYSRWMNAFPTVSALAQADESEVLRLWQGLGYYSRARRLHQGAQYITEKLGGSLPAEPADLLGVPGIGPYSAGAISSIAFNRPSPVVDGNVIRVLSRLYALSGDPGRAPLKGELWRIAQTLVCPSQPGDFNQALMELGALLCTPKKPSCIACPVRRHCEAFRTGQTQRFPELPQRPPPTPLQMVLCFVVHRGRYGVLRLPQDARWWAGLEAFPFATIESHQQPKAQARRLGDVYLDDLEDVGSELPIVRHSVTRFKISLHPFVVRGRLRKPESSRLRWVKPSEFGSLALPAPHRRATKNLFP